MTKPVSSLVRFSLCCIPAILGVSCAMPYGPNPYWGQAYPPPQGGPGWNTDYAPRYGYRGTQSPAYGAPQEGPRQTTQTPPRKRPKNRGESPAELHGSDKPASDTATTEKPTSEPTPSPKANTTNLPYGTPVVGKKGFVYSPYAQDKGMVDVQDIPAGTKVECPYTGKHFRVP